MLTEEILNENHHLDIAESTIENEIYNIVEDLKKKPGFNPNLKFDPKVHLAFDPTKELKRTTFEDLKIFKTHVEKISNTAAIEPFSLFTDDAIDMMKYEVFSNTEVLRKYGRKSATGFNTSDRDFVVSGFSEVTPFCREAWTHPETLKIFSDLMGVDLYMPHCFNQSHINASLAPRKRGDPAPQESQEDFQAMKELQDQKGDEIPSAISWHYDSVPLVCVLMLSAPPNMIGGETGIRDGDEKVIRIADPKEGQASVLQARVIKHIATKPLNKCDRISYVVSFLPKDPSAYDSTCATSERPGAVPTFTNDRFYPNFVNYRMDRVKQRLDLYQKKIMEQYQMGGKFDQLEAIDFMKDIESYLHRTWHEFEAVSDTPYPPPLFKIPYKDL